MSFSQGIQTTSGIAAEGNVEVHRDINITINTTTIHSTAKKEPRIWKPFCTVPAPTPHFSGREDLIAQIHRQIQQCSIEKEYSKKIIVIHGLGGMGKSELVRKYVQMHRQDPFILNAAWINAESKNSLESSFKSMAEKLSLKPKEAEVEDVVSSIYEYLAEQSQPSLFIFDNAEQMRSEDNVFGIFEFLPTTQLDTIPLIIITTRFKDWEISEENILQINELSEEAGVKFLTERWRLSSAQRQDEAIKDALKDLARSLQCFPLGLTLAASNIRISKLRSIPTEIKDYILKINSPHEGWIMERHSPGSASKYDLIMNNVWAATLEKIKSQGEDGEAAISLLNIIAYFPTDEITVEEVVKVAEFSGLPTSTAGIEMLELYSLISLPNIWYQPIRIHRLVQRCTRDKLNRKTNYTNLINLSIFLARQKNYFVDIQAIHEHLNKPMWLENSIQFSIIFACKNNWINDNDIMKDVYEVFELEKNPSFVHNLAVDYKILYALNLFRVSTNNYHDDDIGYKKLCENLISKHPSYSKKYLEQVFVSTLGKCVKGLFKGTMDMEDLAKRAILCVLINIVEYEKNERTMSEKVQEEILLILFDATCNSFEGSVGNLRDIYSFLWKICCCYKFISNRWYVKSVFKIHGSVYASIQETGGSRLDSYWEDDKPIPYKNILEELKDNSNAEWIRRFVESFCTEAGLQFLRQHLQYLDAITQTEIDLLPCNAKLLFEFISFLGWKWNCTKKFDQEDLFMETLYSVTKNVFILNIFHIQEDQFWCLMTWFGIFGNKTCVDQNGVSWSIRSVEKEMKLFLDDVYSDKDILEHYSILLSNYSTLLWNAPALLNKFIKSSGRYRNNIAVKTAKKMLKYLGYTIPHSTSGLLKRLTSF